MFFAPLFMSDAKIVICGPPAAETLLAAPHPLPLTAATSLHLPSSRPGSPSAPRPWANGRSGPHASKQPPSPTLARPSATGLARETRLSATSPTRNSPSVHARCSRTAVATLLNQAHGASLLVHDCQYTDDEYLHHIGWHPPGEVLAFARLTEAQRSSSSTATRSTTTRPRSAPCRGACRSAAAGSSRTRSSWPPSCKSSSSTAPANQSLRRQCAPSVGSAHACSDNDFGRTIRDVN